MAWLFIVDLDICGGAASTTGARSLTSNSLKSGRAISDTVVVLNSDFDEGVAFFCRCINFCICF